ncbi:hypothetical protein [Actinomadura parmotrematis]|uniref:DUF8094 domain-containing protein n=1 Tax=Actinomadura parmotrematis TaxID=2864039 RepID=A0ABS7G4B1_9ACTN|nr:hypothetical protein [Actinomadura parmotrematis]MBW8487549.1 hypothetical protein [Actinomadura parmotrematis]
MRKTSVAVAALLLAVPAALAGCGGGGKARVSPVAMPSVPAPTPEPLTPQAATQAFQSYIVNDDVARAAGDERLALSWVSDGQFALTASEYRKAAFDGRQVARYTYGRPRLYVPKIEEKTYPQWFVADVRRGVAGASGKDAGGRQTLMGFVRKSAADGWTLSSTTALAPKAHMPKVLVDADGYATSLSPTDASLLIKPRSLPGIQATIASEGPDSVATGVMRTGAFTTGLYSQTRREVRKARNLNRQTVVVATGFPLFALRAEHGAALVLYALSRNTTLTPKSGDRDSKPPIPAEVAFLLDGTVDGNEIDMYETLQMAAYDPGRAKKGATQAKADVLGQVGGYIKASTPPLKSP